MEIGSLTLGIIVLQLSLIPTHLFLYLTRRFDITRLRFLLLSIIFAGFSSVWSYNQPNSSIIGDILLLFSGLTLTFSTLLYFSIELNFKIGKSYLVTLFGTASILIISKPLFESYQIPSLIYYSLFEIIVLAACYQLLIKHSKIRKSIRRKPLYVSGIGFFYILAFSPIVAYVFVESYLKYLFFSSSYVLILCAYYLHYFRQMKFENSSNFSDGKLNLKEYSTLRIVERFYFSDSIFGDFDLNERELEVANLLLSGMNYKEIAEKLFLDYSTIRGYASKVYTKTGVFGSKRAEKFREKFGKPLN